MNFIEQFYLEFRNKKFASQGVKLCSQNTMKIEKSNKEAYTH